MIGHPTKNLHFLKGFHSARFIKIFKLLAYKGIFYRSVPNENILKSVFFKVSFFFLFTFGVLLIVLL